MHVALPTRDQRAQIACRQSPRNAHVEPLEPRTLLANHLITFDDLPTGIAVTEEFPFVTFSSPGGGVANVVVRNFDVGVSGGSEPNEIGGPSPNQDSLALDFDVPVVGLSFLVNGISNVGVIARMSITCDGVTAIRDMSGTGAEFMTINLSSFKGITRLVIHDITDNNGIGFDDFRFSDVHRIIGKVVDANNNPLNGVRVLASGVSDPVFTDYPTPNESLDSFNLDPLLDGDFEIFGVNASNTTSLTITARGLDGTNYLQDAPINVFASQYLGDTANVGTIKLTNFKVVDSRNRIVLLADQRNGNNSHNITRRGTTGNTGKIAASLRYQAEVRAVTQKLASLGFRESNGTGTGENAPLLSVRTAWTPIGTPNTNPPPEERAVLLFQTLWFHQGSSSVFRNAVNSGVFTSTSDGRVQAETLAALNSATGVLWALNDATAKAKFPNLFTYQAPSDNRWLHASAVRLLSDLTSSLSGDGVTALNVNSTSAATGGRDVGQSHWAGSEVDITWVATNGGPGSGNFFRPLRNANGTEVAVAVGASGAPLSVVGGVQKEWTAAERLSLSLRTEAQAIAAGRTWRTAENYDRAKTRVLLQRILAFPSTRVQQVIFNDPAFHDTTSSQIIRDSRFIQLSPHNNHIHIGAPFVRDTLNARTSGASAWPPNIFPLFPNRSVTTPILEGGEAFLRGTASDEDVDDLFFLDVDWGDGSKPQTYLIKPTDPRDVEVRHRYRDNGDYIISLVWRDQKGGQNSGTLSVHVDNVAPIVSVGSDTRAASNGWLKRTGFFDDPGADTWAATVDYGDGAGPQSLKLGHDGSFKLHHRYRTAGTFEVTVVVTDDDGEVGVATFKVTA